MGATGTLSPQRMDRLAKLNPILAIGGYTLQELSARFGVSTKQISNDRIYIEQNWWPVEQSQKTKAIRRRREIELEQLKRFAIESYKRSRQDKEEITTSYDKRTCTECGGTGKLPKCRCLNCEGLGYVLDEKVTRKVSGQAGDASFLNSAINCVVQMIKLRGLQIEVVKKHVLNGAVGVEHTYVDPNRFRDVDPELVLEARGAIARIEHLSNGNGE